MFLRPGTAGAVPMLLSGSPSTSTPGTVLAAATSGSGAADDVATTDALPPVDVFQVSGLFDEVMVDDFQDVTTLDFALILAVSRKARLIVAGDDDQALLGARCPDCNEAGGAPAGPLEELATRMEMPEDKVRKVLKTRCARS